MIRQQVIDYLRSKKLRMTALKAEIVDLFLEGACGLSLGEIQRSLKTTCNQSSVYRCLKALESAGFLRQSLGNQNVVRYRCTDRFSSPHGHFKCIACNRVLPVEGLPREYVDKVEKKYRIHVAHSDFILEGRCSKCIEKP